MNYLKLSAVNTWKISWKEFRHKTIDGCANVKQFDKLIRQLEIFLEEARRDRGYCEAEWERLKDLQISIKKKQKEVELRESRKEAYDTSRIS